jgi:hypothetical protein
VSLPAHSEMQNKFWIRDAQLTPIGLSECANVAKTFPFHESVDLVVASPLRRTVQTAVHSLNPILERDGDSDGEGGVKEAGGKAVPFILHPAAQEVSGRACNLGSEREQLEGGLRGWFTRVADNGDVPMNKEEKKKERQALWERCGLGDSGRVDFGLVGPGWCDKVSSPHPASTV